ncbi:spore protease YyaC [Proteiniborus sp. MB09-C3]|uniref:spore protease YyaC n=1 Tax=Proteiniborus sp. MB09-C3 TaxID=3050072 RepID=UPI0025548BAB|nr:spore protease YyaC [Proteiniborus sp. MB09-C3]WIV12070.1 spore protease YyaC [Proteiniborus sp. MB09-C3]
MKNLRVLTTHVEEKYKAAREISNYLSTYFEAYPRHDDIIIVGIGTDKCIGDCLGPLVGTILKKRDFISPVYGTLKRPLHALNLKDRVLSIKSRHPDAFIIAIDACLGEDDSVGTIQIRSGPIDPGKGVGKNLPSVGDLSIIGIVEKLGNDNNSSLHNIRLSFIFEMAEIIAEGIMMGL